MIGGLLNKTGDTNGALESYRSAITMLETWLVSEPAQKRIALGQFITPTLEVFTQRLRLRQKLLSISRERVGAKLKVGTGNL